MPKKKLIVWFQKAQKEFKKLDPRLKLVVYVATVFVVFSFVRTLRAGQIEVIGTHATTELNHLATYIISVSDEGTDKELVISHVTKSGNDLREMLLEFGIAEADMKTTNNYIFEKSENQSVRFAPASQKTWVGGTSIEVKLKDITRVGEFSGALTGLTSLEVYGPTYTVDEDTINEAALLAAAVRNAKQKASNIAMSQHKRIGRILSIQELPSSNTGVYGEVLGMGGAGSNFSPGSTKIEKSVRVVFVLR